MKRYSSAYENDPTDLSMTLIQLTLALDIHLYEEYMEPPNLVCTCLLYVNVTSYSLH